jgi:hypothetical protein
MGKHPFVGTPELNGLKIVLMLVSNWDNKDARDRERGSNTGILEYRVNGHLEWRYFVTDWGGSMGRCGKVFTREKWDCRGFSDQTPGFVKGIKDGHIEWGFIGQHSRDTKDDITISNVKWLLKYLGGISDRQIVVGLQASGATPAEVQCFSKALRLRIDQLKSLTQRSAMQISSEQQHRQ